MTPTGLSRRIDGLGRIVLPIELRRALDIDEGDLLSIAQEGERIVLQKVERACVFCGGAEDLRAYRSKQVCAACAADVNRPPAEPEEADPD